MKSRLDILYRGPLASCNFRCEYCPFGQEPASAEGKNRDRASLDRFVHWIGASSDRKLGVFFTPLGEALVHRRYRNAIIELSHLPHVRRVSVQTNGSGSFEWLEQARADRVGIWLSWHPHAMPMDCLLLRCSLLSSMGIAHSVGVVGCREHLGLIDRLRQLLPDTTYLWINALRRLEPPYDQDEVSAIKRVDPLFSFNLKPHKSLGHECNAGHSVIAVDGDGNIRPCHFQSAIISSIEDPCWESNLRPRRCETETCHCHIGYVHMPELDLESVFGSGRLERVPQHHWKGWGTWHS